MNVPQQLRYAKTHEWVLVEGDVATVGITEFAQSQLGDLTFVELPAPGDTAQAGEDIAVVESVKAASDVYSPVSGKVIESNGNLESDPSLINTDAFGNGWMFKVKMSNPAEVNGLLNAAGYTALLPE